MYSNTKYRLKKIKECSTTHYSTYTLKKLLERLCDHEPAFLDIIKKFIFPKYNFNEISILYYRKYIYSYDTSLIKLIYPVTKDNIDEKIDIMESKLYQERNTYKMKEYTQEMKRELENNNNNNDNEKIDYFTYMDDLINTIGLFCLMKHNPDIIQSRLYYILKYEETIKVMLNVFDGQYIRRDEIYFNTRLNTTRTELDAVQTKYNNYRSHIKQKMEHIFNNVI